MKIEELLLAYIDLIVKCENSLKKNFNIEGIPYLHQNTTFKTGKLDIDGVQLEYTFHGSGCTFILGSIELSYDIYADRENYVVTSPWKFMQFVNSYLKHKDKIEESKIAEYLEMLCKKGIVSKIYENYLIYDVSFNWYRSFKM